MIQRRDLRSLLVCLLIAFGGCSLGERASSQTVNVCYTGNGRTYTLNSTLDADVWVGLDEFSNKTSPTLNIANGANVLRGLLSYDHSVVKMTGGSIANYLSLHDSSTLNFSGGQIGLGIDATDTSNATMTGGSVTQIVSANGFSTVNIYGGTVKGGYYAEGSGTLNVYGSNLLLSNPTQLSPGFFQYNLTGSLNDGTALKSLAYTAGNGQIHLYNVPAPASVFVLLLGCPQFLLPLLRKRGADQMMPSKSRTALN